LSYLLRPAGSADGSIVSARTAAKVGVIVTSGDGLTSRNEVVDWCGPLSPMFEVSFEEKREAVSDAVCFSLVLFAVLSQPEKTNTERMKSFFKQMLLTTVPIRLGIEFTKIFFSHLISMPGPCSYLPHRKKAPPFPTSR
jgi:hypothetical protein